MNSEDEEKKQQEDQELDLFKKFYDFACQCKQQAKEKFEFNYCEDNNKIQFSYDKNNDNLIPTDNMNDIDLTSKPIFCCIGGLFVMLSQGKDGNTNVYALNDNCINKIDNNFNDINANIQDIKPYVFKIKNVPIKNAKKFLLSFVDNLEPSEENNFAKQVKNELDFKYVFSEITENDNKQDIERIVAQNQERIDVMRKFKEQFKGAKLQINNGFSEFKITGFKNNEEINLRYNSKGETYMLDKNCHKKAPNLDNEDYYFGQYDLLMACTKSNNDRVNIYATRADVGKNSFGDNNNDTFAIYNVTQKKAKTFIEKLNTYSIDKDNYNIITEQEQFEKFFQGHCKQSIKIENDDGKNNVCCCGLFNCCGTSKTK